VISLDPTNDCFTNLKYIVAAVGRDYDGVAPTPGAFIGESAGEITSSQCLRVLDVTHATPQLVAA